MEHQGCYPIAIELLPKPNQTTIAAALHVTLQGKAPAAKQFYEPLHIQALPVWLRRAAVS